MKGVVLLLMLVPFAIGNSAFAEIYSNDDYAFTINYPEFWIFSDEIVIYEDGRTTTIEFWDSVDGWVTNVRIDTNVVIENFENPDIPTKDYNAYVLDILKNKLEKQCETSAKTEDFVCSNFKLIEFRILVIDEVKSFQLTYSWTENYSDEISFRNISYYTVISKDGNTWIISSQTLEDHFPEHGPTIQNMIKSFKVTNIETVEEEFQTTLPDEEKNSFIGLIITTVNSMLNMAFELENDPILQGWANDVIDNVAARTEAKIVDQLGYDPTSLEEVNAHLNSKPNSNTNQQKEPLPEITVVPKRLPLENSQPEPFNSESDRVANLDNVLASAELKPAPEWMETISEPKKVPKTITYNHLGLPSGIDKNIVLDSTHEAFRNWEESNPELEFQYVQDVKADVLIKWHIYSNSEHDGFATITLVDDEPILDKGIIDVSLGSVNCRGEYVQFDSGRTTNILMHEIGHILGLGHHVDENHLMYASGFTFENEYDTLGYEIPERYDDWFVGQTELVERADTLKIEYDAIYKQYKKYEGKVVSPSEYTTAITLHSQLNEIGEERNKILQKLDCYPNYDVLES